MIRTASARSNSIAPAISRRLTSTATSATATAPPHSRTSEVWKAVRSTSIVVSPYWRLMSRMFADLLRATPEHLQRRQAAEHVEEERAQVADLGEPPLRDRPRPAADDRQQEDEDRSGEQQDQRRRRVDDEDRAEHEERDGDGQRPGRLERGDVRIERVEPAADDAGQLAAPLAARPGRAEREHVGGQVGPQRALEPPRGTPGKVIDAEQQRPAGDRQDRDGHQDRRDRRERLAAEEDPGHDHAGQVRGHDHQRPRPRTRRRSPATSSRRTPGAWASSRSSGEGGRPRDPVRRADEALSEAPDEPLIAVGFDDGLAPEDVVDAGRVEQHERDPDERR